MVSTQHFCWANLYRAICHSFKNFLYLVPRVIDWTPLSQVLVALFSAPVWCFSFLRCLIYKVHAPLAEQFYYTALCLLCQALISTFSKFFLRSRLPFRSRRLSTTSLEYHAPRPLVKPYFYFFWFLPLFVPMAVPPPFFFPEKVVS